MSLEAVQALGAKALTSNTRLLDVYEMWLEHTLWGLEPLLADLNDATVGQLRNEVSGSAPCEADPEDGTW